MKCVCGYERIEKWEDELQERTKNDPDFKNGDKEFHVAQQSVRIKMYEEGYTTDGVVDRCFCVCPKCGTVKIDLDEW